MTGWAASPRVRQAEEKQRRPPALKSAPVLHALATASPTTRVACGKCGIRVQPWWLVGRQAGLTRWPHGRLTRLPHTAPQPERLGLRHGRGASPSAHSRSPHSSRGPQRPSHSLGSLRRTGALVDRELERCPRCGRLLSWWTLGWDSDPAESAPCNVSVRRPPTPSILTPRRCDRFTLAPGATSARRLAGRVCGW
jgi:ribosomal protein S27AE